jgi:hypothetical protein
MSPFLRELALVRANRTIKAGSVECKANRDKITFLPVSVFIPAQVP